MFEKCPFCHSKLICVYTYPSRSQINCMLCHIDFYTSKGQFDFCRYDIIEDKKFNPDLKFKIEYDNNKYYFYHLNHSISAWELIASYSRFEAKEISKLRDKFNKYKVFL